MIARRKFHQAVFLVAGLYNLGWGAFTILDPQWLFRFAKMPLQNYPEIFACLGMVIGLYGLLYLEVARLPERGWLVAAVGLLGKVLGPIGLLDLIWRGQWPMQTVVLCLTNDLIWWIPFGLYLYDARAMVMNFELDYSEMIFLDAEDLAEGGILTAYQKLAPKLKEHVQEPDQITEMMDHDAPSYAVRHRDVEYLIYRPDLADERGQSWGNAAIALFSIVNAQLANTSYRFYAINGGHDLGGMFLTPEQCEAAKKSLKRKVDWPYLPSAELPWYGQHH